MEKLIDELIMFQSCFDQMRKNFEKNQYVYFDNKKIEGEDNRSILEIKDLVEFSIPQVQPRIDYGYKILKKNNQILY
jgi:hypothetical protein